MKIKWEKNSISKSLAQQGKIKDEDIIEKTQTQNFPAEVATVRIHRVNQKHPNVTLHIRGKSRQLIFYTRKIRSYMLTLCLRFGCQYANHAK